MVHAILEKKDTNVKVSYYRNNVDEIKQHQHKARRIIRNKQLISMT